ncbi:hypothetical protein [Streptomyces vastus]|uniref:Uncharacterized protein n=1 Tax=Streptomyces vastus TaxID=285451 RepID=A0ABP6DLS0_9ACTN
MVAAAVAGALSLQGSPVPPAPDGDGSAQPGVARPYGEEHLVHVTPDHRAAALRAADTRPFSMFGVTWDDPASPLIGTVEVRTRDAETGMWSEWRPLDGDGSRAEETARRGGTDPLWVARPTAPRSASPRMRTPTPTSPTDCGWT